MDAEESIRRRDRVKSYKTHVYEATKRRLTNADIWQQARYSDGTVFYRWLRAERESEPIETVLREKPHLPKKRWLAFAQAMRAKQEQERRERDFLRRVNQEQRREQKRWEANFLVRAKQEQQGWERELFMRLKQEEQRWERELLMRLKQEQQRWERELFRKYPPGKPFKL
jgi:hypothetical protein